MKNPSRGQLSILLAAIDSVNEEAYCAVPHFSEVWGAFSGFWTFFGFFRGVAFETNERQILIYF
jgi:hypothetical protein